MTQQTIIVGAGSAGCVLANRLSADGRRVVLLEAGPDYFGRPRPQDLNRGDRNSFTAHDWGYDHRPTDDHLLPYPFPRGRVVGGSSAVNTCIALRGQPADYDEWADRGLDDWDWEACLPAFRRLETDLDIDDEWHGDEGPLPLRRHTPEEYHPWQAAFVEACREVGYEECPDTNRPGAAGVGPHAMNKIEGRRISAADAWLRPEVRGRRNLEIRDRTLVRRVLFEGERAVGVEVESGGAIQQLSADRVILTAGAIDTPGILLRSGVGPADDLDRLGVDPVAVNPNVGRQLLDHPGCAVFLLPRFGTQTSRDHALIQTVCRFGSGFNDLPNDMLMQPGSHVPTPHLDLPLVSIMVALGKPAGTGELRWPSADPHAAPEIRSRLFDHPDDRQMAVDALQRIWEVCRQPPIREFARIAWPRPAALEDPDRLAEVLTTVCDSGYHPCGTAPMGPDDDPEAACDGRGRVRHTRGLHVADASLMPTIPSANIHLSVLMMAERLAEWL